MRRFPKGYLGFDHVTRGGDLLAVLDAIIGPDFILGATLAQKIRKLKPDEWVPIALLMELYEKLSEKLGPYHMKQVGWTIVKRYHASDVLKRFHSAEEVVYALDALYRQGNRGTAIGGWKVTLFTPTRCEMEKTTPHHCGMEEGIVEEMMRTLGISTTVYQTDCLRKGSDLCRFVIEPKGSNPPWMKAAVLKPAT